MPINKSMLKQLSLAIALSLPALGAAALWLAPSVEAADAKATPTEATGQDFYARGYYPEALEEWKRPSSRKRMPAPLFV